MAEKVAKVGVKKESGYLYFVDKKGNVSRASMARGRKKGKGGVLTFWGIGYNQMLHGQHNTISIINLHLLTGNVGRPGCGTHSQTGQPKEFPSPELGLGKWNVIKITVSGKKVEAFLNGVSVQKFTTKVTKGAICFQSEGAPLEFKDIKIKSLK